MYDHWRLDVPPNLQNIFRENTEKLFEPEVALDLPGGKVPLADVPEAEAVSSLALLSVTVAAASEAPTISQSSSVALVGTLDPSSA